MIGVKDLTDVLSSMVIVSAIPLFLQFPIFHVLDVLECDT